MYYGEIKKRDIADGPGVRVSLFVSGCTHHCPGCFNPETWSFHYGQPFTAETEEELLAALAPSYVSGLTLLGGEPMEPENQTVLAEFVRRVRECYPQKSIWCYSGYTYETELLPMKETLGEQWLLPLVDVLVDGEFIQAQKNISLQFRGSENQRIIDVQRSLETGETILWKP